MRAITENAVATGWELLEACRVYASSAPEQTLVHPNRHLSRQWHALSIGHGDLGIALVLSVANELDPDGGWDTAAHQHVAKAVAEYRQTPGLQIGLLSGIGGLAWCLTALSRDGTRYRSALRDIEARLKLKMAAAIEELERSETVPVETYDMASGLCGAVTYCMSVGGDDLTSTAEDAVEALATAVLSNPTACFRTGPDQVSSITRTFNPELSNGYRDFGTAHGIAGVLHVLGQAADRGIGGRRTKTATDTLANEILTASESEDGTLDVPYFVYPESATRSQWTRTPTPTRHAWCYGNLGAALAFKNSTTLATNFPTALSSLLPAPSLNRPFVTDPGLCHGWAGSLLLERYLLGDTTSAASVRNLLALRSAEERFGFREHVGDMSSPSSPGFLDESGGAASALLGLSCPAASQPKALQIFIGAWR